MPGKRPLLLDLFCGEGGASLGYYQVGFDVIGVDIFKQSRYPFPFIQANALKLKVNLNAFDAIHASPPCQLHSPLARLWTHAHTNLIPPVLDLLGGFHGPWVVENVVGAAKWLPGAVQVCGAAAGCYVDAPYPYVLRRHRLFMGSNPLVGTPCECSQYKDRGYKIVDISGHGGANSPTSRSHRPGENIVLRRRLMQVPHASSQQISQCIPAPYTRWIGRQLISQV